VDIVGATTDIEVMQRSFMVGALLGLFGMGCGGSADSATAYVGTWEIGSGLRTPNCGGGPGDSYPVTGSVTVEAGASPETLRVHDAEHGPCVWTLSVTGQSAMFLSGSPCSVPAGVVNATVTPHDYLFSLSSDHQATVVSSFTWVFDVNNCTDTEQEALVR
jgi:hypothetical protein